MICSGWAVVAAEVGLHARPAADLVRAVETSQHRVTLSNSAGREANGASILGVLSLGAKQGDSINIRVDGDDSERVLESLIAIVEGRKAL